MNPLPAITSALPGSVGAIQEAGQLASGMGGLAHMDQFIRDNKFQEAVNLGKQLLGDPKYEDYQGGVQLMIDHASRKLGGALPAVSSSIPLGALAGLSIIPQHMLDQFYQSINPAAQQQTL